MSSFPFRKLLAFVGILSVVCAVALTVANPMWRFSQERRKEKGDTMDARVVKLYGGRAGIEPIVSPVKVEAYRIKNKVFQPEEKPRPLGGYPIVSGPHKVDKKTAAEIGKLLSDLSTYDWEKAKGCELVPSVAIRFIRNDSTTEVIFCLDCDELVIYRGKKRINGKGFELVRRRFVRIVKQIFPKDDVIQSLSEVNPRP